jgi:tetratricopeptide (TPR) repeat protein
MYRAVPAVPRRIAGVLAALTAGCIAWPSATAAQALRLGEVDFANSGTPDAQAAFERGLLLLHSFEYWTAADAFREAREIDPDFAMAYWGEAMTHNHPVWMQQDREAALEALNRFAPTPEERALQAGPEGGGTAREAAYMRAVDVLYGPGEKEARDFAYLDAMAALHEAYPDDADAAALHALALLGTAHAGRDFATYMRAAGILEQVVDGHPEHPGIAHYLIHSYDDPIHAPLGIRAARAYSDIAPDAPHAQHMTSHIFVALGMWEDVVEANENTLRVLDRARAADDLTPAACGHYNFWLEYGYLQRGREEDALRLVRECYDRVVSAAERETDGPIDSYGRMLARYVIDAGDVEPVRAWPVDWSEAPGAYVHPLAAQGYVAAGRSDVAGLEATLASLETAREGIEARAAEASDSGGNGLAGLLDILQMELEALLHARRDEIAAAIELAREAAEREASMPFEFGPPHIDKPTYELLGELLLEAGRAEEAQEAFEAALARTPGRVAALEGLAAAQAEIAVGAAVR